LTTTDATSRRRSARQLSAWSTAAPGSEPELIAAATGTVYVKDAPQKKVP